MYKLLKYDFVWMNYYSAALLFSSQCSTELFNRYFLEHWAIEPKYFNIGKNCKKMENHKFLSRAIIWLNLIKMSSIDMFSHISMHIWWVFEEKIENFSFSFFFAFCHFLGFWQYVTYDYQIWENSWFFGPNGFWQFH